MNQIKPHSLFTKFDLDLFTSGKHFKLYEKMGCHGVEVNGNQGLYFAVYAPAAKKVEIIGDFNQWDGTDHALFVRWDDSGIWEGFIEGLQHPILYKYRIYSNHDSKIREKADPFAFCTELMPKSASVSYELDYTWDDQKWMSERHNFNSLESPISVYEVHLGSWKKENGNSLSYIELADQLVNYVVDMGFTHVEFLPITEHPFYPSWGYLSTSYFAPTSRYGDPNEFMFLIDVFHREGIGVIMDWVPAHFPSDEFALADFDGSALFEHPDRKKGFHPDWNSLIFNFERPEIVSFLISSAHFWFDKYHIDGIRVDAVSSMLYLDYSREDGEWEPNIYGGNEYLAAIDFLKELNKSVYATFPGVMMVAEESTAYPGITKPVHHNGLGFGLKWMMGWMNDTLRYFERDPIHRKHHHNEISFSMTYAFSENFVLALSHDEVVHGKKSLVYKMPGDDWQKFANLRLLYTYMFTHPGQKLLFMGNEFGDTAEWDNDNSLHWEYLEYKPHSGIQLLVKKLNQIYRNQEPLFKYNYSDKGFEWIDYSDNQNSTLIYIRKSGDSRLLVILNFTPGVLQNYRVGIDGESVWTELFNSDDKNYFGSGIKSEGPVKTSNIAAHNRSHSIEITVPPLAGIILKEENID